MSNDVFLDDEEFTLKRNEGIRTSVITAITSTPNYHKDTESLKILMGVVDSSDKAVFGKSKARLQAKGADDASSVADSVRAFMAMATMATPIPREEKKNRHVDYSLDRVVPGETQIGQFPLTLDDLQK